MIVRTYTSAWNLPTKIYAFDDVRVPVQGGISIPQLLAGLGTALVWIPLCIFLGLPNYLGTGLTISLMIVPPIVVFWAADKPIAHEKTLQEWIVSWFIRLAEPKRLTSLVTAADDRSIVLSARRWVPQLAADYGRPPADYRRSFAEVGDRS